MRGRGREYDRAWSSRGSFVSRSVRHASSRLRVLALGLVLLAAGLAAAFALHAEAAALVVWLDPAGDQEPGAPDIVELAVSNDDAGYVAIQVALANRPSIQGGDNVLIFIDTDRSLSTPDPALCQFGAEYGVGLATTETETEAGVLRCIPGLGLQTFAAPTFSWSYDEDNQILTFELNRSELGGATGFNFLVIALGPGGVLDFAPQQGTGAAQGSYDVVISPPPAVPAAGRSWGDPVGGEPAGVPDVKSVRVSNDEARLGVEVVLANRPALNELDAIGVYLDTDFNATTGCSPYGAEYLLLAGGAPGQDDFAAQRCVGGAMQDFAPASYVGSYQGTSQTATFRIDRSEVGNPRALTFRVHAIRVGGSSDQAPDVGPAGHQLVLAPLPPTTTETTTTTTTTAVTTTTQVTVTAAPAPPRDRVRPRVRALDGTAKRGATARLRYTVFDDSGTTREVVRIFAPRLLGVKQLRLAPTEQGELHVVTWRVPRTARSLKFCVQAWDQAGNASASDCGNVRVRR